MLRGRAGRDGYALYLRNLLPAYRALEQGLERHRSTPGLGALAEPALYRQPGARVAILLAWPVPDWHEGVADPARGRTLRPTGRGGGRRAPASRLIGHAYTRYLGDLSGGQILSRLLAKSLALGPATLAFYDFPGDLRRRGVQGRTIAIDSTPPRIEFADVDSLLDEAAMALRAQHRSVGRPCKRRLRRGY